MRWRMRPRWPPGPVATGFFMPVPFCNRNSSCRVPISWGTR
ncbi:hypothetical protein SXCC_03424 [Gluconacetobacter sp. SXCC-1]|nr:hypothetical protein SXCC_03424 [Gluconacetobacter sp. SXCC-1]